MASKINILAIVGAHYQTLKDTTVKPKPRISLVDKLTFFIAPLVVAGVFMRLHLRINNDYVNIIVSTLSIFVGLLLNMIVVLFDIIRDPDRNARKVAVLEDVLANISFTIVLSIFTIGIVLITQLQFGRPTWQPWIEHGRAGLNFIAFVSLALFAFTLLMVVKRMYLLFMDEVEKAKKITRKKLDEEDAANLALRNNPLQ
jgi:hypothetical protein